MHKSIKIITGVVAIVGLMFFLRFIDIYEYPPEIFKSGKSLISQSDFYLMQNEKTYFLDGVKVDPKVFAENTEGVFYINGKVHLQGGIWAWTYYVWELLIISLLFIIWYAREDPDGIIRVIPLFGATVWIIRLIWQLVQIFNLLPKTNVDEVCKQSSYYVIPLFFMTWLLMKYIKNYRENKQLEEDE